MDWNIFAPKEVRACNRLVDELLVPETASSVSVEKAIRSIRPKVKRVIRDDPQTVTRIRDGRAQPKNLVLSVIVSVIYGELCSGHHHSFRGVLSLRGQGLLELWDANTRKLYVAGVIDADEFHRRSAYVREEIKKVG
jgi:hypothetical protein